MKVDRGSVVIVDLDPTLGHEQRGSRPSVIISNPDVILSQRFPTICIVPISGTAGQGVLYPPLSPGPSGLVKHSFALIDQLRSIDKRRIKRLFGELRSTEIAAIDEGLEVFLRLGRKFGSSPGAASIQ